MKMNFFVKLSIFAIILLSIVQIIVSNRLSTTGIELGKLDDTIKQYKETNSLLREDMLLVSSFTSIASSASYLGFVNRKPQIVFTNSLPIALKQ